MERPEVGRDSAFVLQPRDVVIETFADETVVVHLGTGRYFSIDLIGTEVVELLRNGNQVGVVVDHLSARYGADRDVVDGAVVSFVGQLLDEGLIGPDPDGRSSGTIPDAAPPAGGFTAPTLAVYSDMEDLLLLDPIHDVDETGWPVRAEPAAGDQGASADTE